MWCGYENFVDHIRQIAPFVDDATFFVGDESGETAHGGNVSRLEFKRLPRHHERAALADVQEQTG